MTHGLLLRRTAWGFTGYAHGHEKQIVAGHQPVEHYIGRALSVAEKRYWWRRGFILLATVRQ